MSHKFVLVGPHAGKTMNVNGHQFEDGEFTFVGGDAQAAVLARVFEFYGALPADKAELVRLKGREREPGRGRKELDQAIAGLPGDHTDPDYVVNSMRNHWGDLFTAGDELMVREVVVKPEGDKTDATVGDQTNTQTPEPPKAPIMPSLAEAIGLLDPSDDQDWTSNNLPNLERLEALTGKKPSRADVEAIADGYTRAKAKAAKA
ncbi:hypothetical protein P9A53_gp23 [Xanthomonas phage vB_Xar_IVIA-DoCa6]|uniref:Uncharacterized protein n=1 Tax=Xanthomonas phage vB_Xar_IVIA-DoCa6 TaxID=2975533 RepID=A0A9X9NYU4_9CAUD|nr:hypothetical protein P9A52_gp28 [Stenotrophomonas phage vB_SmaS-AXL_1]YP_010739073.1 hypothetical protein P9A53_gp23 [Xanthomonas phage vB_Xar_IVIA-DoCa6]UIS24756.1 hypothetical protein AXL1_28 [Stenotrophomonas phage vB_SmaS-AXL_1]UYA98767.1 hypothetical protein IVIADoCa6_23 [Xanthomonas phage vB_Xar_IVIA-DoCa6]